MDKSLKYKRDGRRTSDLNDRLVFISHDSLDDRLAEAFSTLLKRVGLEKIQIFRSSARKGTEGITYGEEWFNSILYNIEQASSMICILTTRSIDKPWIFWEAGVAIGRKIPVYCLTVGLSLDEACKGPFAHFQNSLDDMEGLTGLIDTLLDSLELDRNQFLIGKAVEDFLKEEKKILSETDPPSVDTFLRPDPEVATTLHKMKRNLFAIDGIIEVCRSVGYSGWGRRDMALPEIFDQRALPYEFNNYKGEDALCKSGSQARYSLLSISEPLHDAGRAQIKTTLARSEYADVFRLSRLLDKPFIQRSNQMISGRSLYGYSWYPLDKSSLIHNVNTQPIIITEDQKVILLKRSSSVHHYPGCWSASIEEQMVAPEDEVNQPDQTYFDCAERGVREELACTPNPEETLILSVGIEHGNLSASFLCLVHILETFKEACDKWLRRAQDAYEASAIDCLELNRRTLLKALNKRDYQPSKEVCVRNDASIANWHPTARMRLYGLMRYMEEINGMRDKNMETNID